LAKLGPQRQATLRYKGQCKPCKSEHYRIKNTEILWYLQGTGFRISVNIKILKCSSPLYKML
jgi:hypothetical protein